MQWRKRSGRGSGRGYFFTRKTLTTCTTCNISYRFSSAQLELLLGTICIVDKPGLASDKVNIKSSQHFAYKQKFIILEMSAKPMKGSKHLYFHKQYFSSRLIVPGCCSCLAHPQVIPTLPLNQFTVEFFSMGHFKPMDPLDYHISMPSGFPGSKLHTSAIAVILCRFETQTISTCQ